MVYIRFKVIKFPVILFCDVVDKFFTSVIGNPYKVVQCFLLFRLMV